MKKIENFNKQQTPTEPMNENYYNNSQTPTETPSKHQLNHPETQKSFNRHETLLHQKHGNYCNK